MTQTRSRTWLSSHGQLVARFGSGGVATVSVGGTLGGAGSSYHGLFGSSAVSIMRHDETGAAQAATVLFDARGGHKPAPNGAAFITDVPSGAYDYPNGTVWWRGSLVLAGATYPEDFATGDAFVAKLGLDGVLDEGFGGGIVQQHLELEHAAYNDVITHRYGLAAVGWEFSELPELLTLSDALVVRYRSDGTLDPSFGAGTGVVLLDYQLGRAVCGPTEHIEEGGVH